MKNIIITIWLLVSLSIAATAQTQTGNLFIGGNINWNNNEFEVNDVNNASALGLRIDKQNTFNFQTTFGTFVKDNLVLGMFLNYENIDSESSNSAERSSLINKTKAISVGPFVRKFFPLNEKFSFYTQGSVGYSRSSNRQTYESNNQGYNSHLKYNKFVAALKPGLVYFATNKFGVDLSVQGLQYIVGKEKDTDQSFSRFDAGFNLPNLTIGLNLYLGR